MSSNIQEVTQGEVSVPFFSIKKTYSGVFVSVFWSTPNVLKSSTLYDTEVICSTSGFSTEKKINFSTPGTFFHI